MAGKSLAHKILEAHLVSGELVPPGGGPAGEIAIKIDQTLTQDATGTMAYLQFETMGLPRVKTQVSCPAPSKPSASAVPRKPLPPAMRTFVSCLRYAIIVRNVEALCKSRF